MHVYTHHGSNLLSCMAIVSVCSSPRYNAIFQFLLLLRRTQIRLQQSWAVFMQHRERVDELRRVSELRTHMGFLVDSLLYYVQVCVGGSS